MSEEKHEFKTGAVRSRLDDVRYDLVSVYALARLAATYAEGAKKYGERNWEKGMEASNLVNHTLQHIFSWLQGDDNEEDHLAHAFWNLATLMHFEETRPDLIDIPSRAKTERN
ncbi:hypothetical protein LCGC14_1848370 [marine sediment metagenome]|uniref:dATP/dGTP diphosphohydrolase N-terminal domain-containing protein n=1 Tax=marine sediment metagenome TaxID=412755 RepID=A0A0F9GZE0_9ZZZZ